MLAGWAMIPVGDPGGMLKHLRQGLADRVASSISLNVHNFRFCDKIRADAPGSQKSFRSHPNERYPAAIGDNPGCTVGKAGAIRVQPRRDCERAFTAS